MADRRTSSRAVLPGCVVVGVLILFLSSSVASAAQSTGQTKLTLSYSVVGGGIYRPPSVWYYLNGKNVTSLLSGTPQTYNVDTGTEWGVTKDLGGSNGTTRWENSAFYIFGNVIGYAGGQTMNFVYYRQNYATFGIPSVVANTESYLPTVNYTALGVEQSIAAGQSIWADYGTAYNYSAVPGASPGERWYFPSPAGTVIGAFEVIPSYYDQYQLNLTLGTVGAVPLTSAPFTVTYGGTPANLTLPIPGGSFWVDANSSLDFQSAIYPTSGTYRWEFHSVNSPTATGPAAEVVSYYEQEPIAVSYSLSSGQAPAGPVITGTSDGQPLSVQLYPGSPTTWMDYGTQYAVSQLLLGSTSTERWSTPTGTNGTIDAPVTLNLEYYHQFLEVFSYGVSGGGSIPAPNATFFSFGAQGTVTLGSSQESVWADYGGYLTFTGAFSSSSTERWELGSAPSVLVTSSQAFSLVYYHQYGVQPSYSVSGGGTPPLPTLSGSELGAPYSTPATPGSLVWLDAGSPWALSPTIAGPSGERWLAVASANGTVESSTAPDATYQHEYLATIIQSPPGSGTLTSTQWVDSGGVLSVSELPSAAWAFTGWHGTGQGSYSGGNQTFTLVVSSPVQETGYFDAEFVVLVNGGGNVVVSFDSNSYTVTSDTTFFVAPGTNVTMVAKPNLLDTFAGWGGVAAGQTSAAVVTLRTPMVITAKFAVNEVVAFSLIVLVSGVMVYLVATLILRLTRTERRRKSVHV